MRVSRSVRAAAAACALALAVGCGGGSGRQKITGAVSQGGRPLASGTITFLKGTPPGPAGGAMIRDGAFSLAGDQGLDPGTYLVAISAPVPGGVLTPEEKAAGASARAKESIPAKYNTDTTLSVEVTAGGRNHFEFSVD